MILTAAGCWDSRPAGEPKVVGSFGRTGRGDGAFVYPRGIESDGERLFVVDKTGRIQRFDPRGQWLGGNANAADRDGQAGGSDGGAGRATVCGRHALPSHRRVFRGRRDHFVVRGIRHGRRAVHLPHGRGVRARRADVRQRVRRQRPHQRFRPRGQVPLRFRHPGSGRAALAAGRGVDASDDCTWPTRAITGSPCTISTAGCCGLRLGREPGQLRYPYGLALMRWDLVVCEYGNNRLQVFTRPGESWRSTAARPAAGATGLPLGRGGDEHRRAFMVDAGNNRIQVWQL